MARQQRNPGPSWGFALLRQLNRHAPPGLRDALVHLGATVACGRMPRERAASRLYLEAVRKHPASIWDVIRHFQIFSDSMMAKLRSGDGAEVTFEWASPEDEANGKLLFENRQILLGTFHCGGSEFLGFHSLIGNPMAMLRQRRANSGDIEPLIKKASGHIRIVWVGEGESTLFAIRDLIDEGYTLAMQCDRVEHAAKTEAFDFLGARRPMPVSIYRLARLYQLPVCFCVALPTAKDLHFQVKAPPPFLPEEGAKSGTAAHAHFQEVLHWLEDILVAHPYQWFNFVSLPVIPGQ